MSKRYILFRAEGDLGEGDLKDMAAALASMGWKAKVIPVEGNARLVIVRADNVAASQIRARGGEIILGGRPLVSILTSGAVGNLKRRAKEADEDGQIHE